MSADGVATRDDATARAERIRSGIRSYTEMLADIETAFRSRDWVALGYPTWDAYTTGEFSEARLQLAVGQREEAVRRLRSSGMSVRAIGSALGVSKDTVARVVEPPIVELPGVSFETGAQSDQSSLGVSKDAVRSDPRQVDQIDPPADSDQSPPSATGETPHLTERGDGRERSAPVRPSSGQPITGLDGKAYGGPKDRSPAPKPPEDRRAPLTAAVPRIALELTRVVNRIETLHADERFTRNTAAVAAHMPAGELRRCIQILQDLHDAFPARPNTGDHA